MTTKYNVGDTVMVPFKIRLIRADSKKTEYELIPIGNNPERNYIPEDEIVGCLDDYYNLTNKVTHEHE